VIRWGSVGTLVLISLAIMGSPGPAMISLVAAGSVRGVRRSFPYLFGIIVGTTLVLVAVATGITAALLAVPAIGSVLIWISVAYISDLAGSGAARWEHDRLISTVPHTPVLVVGG
jgi:threonine/homoserine/homoserine lactone efflux protein